jgi:flagellar basal-body rod modification protein FlgD
MTDVAALGLRAAQPVGVPERRQTLGQNEFLTLLTTQLRNQDPLSPMDNEAFVAQLAQFATVSGITEMNQSLGALSLSQARAAAPQWLDRVVTGPDGSASRVISVGIDEAGILALTLESGAILTPAQVRAVALPPGDTP